MKKLLILMLVGIMFELTSASTLFLTPLKDNTKTYKSNNGKSKTKTKLTLGEVYSSSKKVSDRLFIDDLGVWVHKGDVSYELSKMVVEYKAKYLVNYQEDKEKEKERKEKIIKENPQLPKKIKKDILEAQIRKNWPESLVVLSWGEPERRADFINKRSVKETRLLYGQTMLIFENDSLKYETTHFTGVLSVHLDKKRDEVEKADRSVTDSTLLGDLKFAEDDTVFGK